MTQMAPGAAGLAPPLPLVRSQELGRASTQSMGLGQGKWGDPQIMLYKQTRQPDVQSGGIKFGGWQGRRGGGLLKWEGSCTRASCWSLSLASIGMGVGVEAWDKPSRVPVLCCPASPAWASPCGKPGQHCSVSHPLGNEPVFFVRSVDQEHYL